MKRYSLSDKQRRSLAQHHREFQAAVAVFANRAVGVQTDMPQAIGKYEGGVKVNDLDIVIYANIVQEDWMRLKKTLPEEIAVASAMEEVAKLFTKRGSKILEPYRDMTKTMYGNPLQVALLDFTP